MIEMVERATVIREYAKRGQEKVLIEKGKIEERRRVRLLKRGENEEKERRESEE